jgi:tetratricopeptide (TPR) repeat protein
MDKALSDFTQAINIKSDYTPAYYQRAVVRRDLGNLEQARQDYEKAKSLNPKLPNPLGN